MDVTYAEPHLSSAAAHAALQRAVQHAESLELAICCAVVDRCGELIAFLKMDGAPPAAPEFARRKAITSAMTRRPTDEVTERLKPDGPMAGYFTLPNICVFPGGIPIRFNDRVIGAIGVSGGTGEADIACATAGIEALVVGA
jgi:uncharacterized protein GlcG (DUF336 family)